MSFRQRIGADQDHRPGGGLVNHLSNANCMAHQNILLQLGNLVCGDDLIFESAKSGSDPINDLTAVNKILYCSFCTAHLLPGRVREDHLYLQPAFGSKSNLHHLFKGQTGSIKDNLIGHNFLYFFIIGTCTPRSLATSIARG